MPNLVSGLAGYNFYLDGTTKLNDTPIGDGVPFTPTGLASNTDYSSRITVKPVDNAGNEGTAVAYTGLGVHTLNPAPAESPMGATDAANIQAIIAKCVAAGAGPGLVVGITSPRGYLYTTGGTGVTTDMHFDIASQTKSFVATVVMRCVDAGLISLTDTLSDYLPGYACDPTITQMMSMHSGIYDYEENSSLATDFVLSPARAETVDQIIAIIKAGTSGRTGKSEFAPGSQYYYTNSNYFLLAKIVESVDPSHRTIDKILIQDVITPLGMVNTSFRLTTGTPPAPYAKGYDHNPILAALGLSVNRDVSKQNPNFTWAAGAIDSVISDLVKWGAEMRDGTLLSADSHNLMMNTFYQQPIPVPYGLQKQSTAGTYGYGLGRVSVGSWMGHDGSWLGYDSVTFFEPVTGTIISVLENFQTSNLKALELVWYEIASYLLPGSADAPGYLQGLAATGGMATSMKKLTTSVAAGGYSPGSFTPFTELNVDHTNQPIPPGATYADVTITAEGGSGGYGGPGINKTGGSGGGGAGKIKKIRVPVSAMGTTYSTSHGQSQTPGSGGADSYFRSGTVDLTAHGGGQGNWSNALNATAAGGAGGTWSATPSTINGNTVIGVNGKAGDSATKKTGTHTSDADFVNDGCAGGGAGGGNTNSGNPGTAGGNSATQSGGLPGDPGDDASDVTVSGAGGAGGGGGNGGDGYQVDGGDGGDGGNYGGGGGGGGGTWGGNAGTPGVGGKGMVLVEWDSPAPPPPPPPSGTYLSTVADLTACFEPEWTQPVVSNAQISNTTINGGPGFSFVCTDSETATWDSTEKDVLAVKENDVAPVGTTQVWEFDVLFPTQTLQSDWHSCTFWEWHTDASSGNCLVTKSPGNGFIDNSIVVVRQTSAGQNYDYVQGPAITWGTVMHVKIDMKWSYGSDGHYRVWINGTQYLNWSGPTCFSGDGDPYLQFGWYSMKGQHLTNRVTIGNITRVVS